MSIKINCEIAVADWARTTVTANLVYESLGKLRMVLQRAICDLSDCIYLMKTGEIRYTKNTRISTIKR